MSEYRYSFQHGPWAPIELQAIEFEFRSWFSEKKVQLVLADLEAGTTIVVHRRPGQHKQYRKEAG